MLGLKRLRIKENLRLLDTLQKEAVDFSTASFYYVFGACRVESIYDNPCQLWHIKLFKVFKRINYIKVNTIKTSINNLL